MQFQVPTTYTDNQGLIKNRVYLFDINPLLNRSRQVAVTGVQYHFKEAEVWFQIGGHESPYCPLVSKGKVPPPVREIRLSLSPIHGIPQDKGYPLRPDILNHLPEDITGCTAYALHIQKARRVAPLRTVIKKEERRTVPAHPNSPVQLEELVDLN
jgi:hypothetical protein